MGPYMTEPLVKLNFFVQLLGTGHPLHILQPNLIVGCFIFFKHLHNLYLLDTCVAQNSEIR